MVRYLVLLLHRLFPQVSLGLLFLQYGFADGLIPCFPLGPHLYLIGNKAIGNYALLDTDNSRQNVWQISPYLLKYKLLSFRKLSEMYVEEGISRQKSI